jgi:hypothetical protein
VIPGHNKLALVTEYGRIQFYLLMAQNLPQLIMELIAMVYLVATFTPA